LDQLSERKKFQTDSITTVIKKKLAPRNFTPPNSHPPTRNCYLCLSNYSPKESKPRRLIKTCYILLIGGYRWLPKKNTAQIPNTNLLLSATHLCKSLPNKWHPVPPRTKRSAEASLSGAVPEVRSMEQHDQQILKNVVACRVLITWNRPTDVCLLLVGKYVNGAGSYVNAPDALNFIILMFYQSRGHNCNEPYICMNLSVAQCRLIIIYRLTNLTRCMCPSTMSFN
jgi:hypothetical protein